MRIWTVWGKDEYGVFPEGLFDEKRDAERLASEFDRCEGRVLAIDIPDSAVEQLFAERAVEGKVGEE